VAIDLDRLDEAEDFRLRARSVEPASPSVRAVLGEVALSRRDYRRAAELLEAALEALPAATRLHYPLALAYRGLGDEVRAREHLALRGVVGARPPDPLLDELEELKLGERVHVVRGGTAFRAGGAPSAVYFPTTSR
jgi:predicted Zn-dependent protease